MPTFEITSPDGRKFQVTAPEGTSHDEVLKYAQANMPASKQAGSALNGVPRQFGLAARYGLEGLGGAAEVVSEPIRAITDRLTDNVGKTKSASGLASQFADYIGLPKPQNADERVVGDATRMLVGAVGMAGAANTAAKATSGITSKALAFLADNPLQQAATAAGAGLAGGASREAGGNELQQGASSFIGGLGGAGALSLAQGGANLAKQLLSKGLTQQQLDVKIGNLLQRSGVDYSQMPASAKQSLRAELVGALNADKEIDPAALSRLAAFKEAGITPTRGMVSQNPVQITREMNLAKMGANSSDEGLQGLALMQNRNNAKLIENLNDLGANRGNADTAGQTVVNAVTGRRDALRNAEQAAWDSAKSSPGYTQPINAGVLSDVNAALDAEGLMPFMNPTISKYMEAFQSGAPFTPQAYRNLQSMLSREIAKGSNEGAAASLARRVLEQSDLKPAGFANGNNSLVTQGMAAGMRAADGMADDAIGAVNQARSATRQAYAYEDSSPLVRSVLSNQDPQTIAKRFVLGGTANEAEDLLRQVGPQGVQPIKDAIFSHIKSKALSGAADETGKFSQAAFNKALNDIGERKLSLVFSPEELRALRTNGRVAALMMSQPVGSAVNNSNSGALLLGRGYDALMGLAGKIPLGKSLVVDPAKNIEVSLRTRAAQNVLPSLIKQQEKSKVQPLLLPAVMAGGLLSTP